MINASYNKPFHSPLESARLNAKITIHFRIAKRTIELISKHIFNHATRNDIQFQRNLIRFTQDIEFREAMWEYIHMEHIVENLKKNFYGIIPQELIIHIVQYEKQLPITNW